MQSLIIDFSYAKDGGYLKGTFQYGIELAKSLSQQVLPYPIECVVSGPINAEYVRMRLSSCNVRIRSIELPRMVWFRYLCRQIYFMRSGRTDSIVISIGSCGVIASAFNAVVIHDLYWIDMPQIYRFTQFLYYKVVVATAMRWADLVIVTTYTTKHRVDRLRNKRASTSFVHYYLQNRTALSQGSDEPRQNICAVTSKRSEFSILTVAANTANKNLLGVLKAYQQLQKEDRRWRLTIVTDSEDAVQDLAGSMNLKIRVLERITDSELRDLYRKSLYYWQLSFVEGFGLPLIEALGEHCRIICSDIPVFREILDDAACYVDSKDPCCSVCELCQNWPLSEQEVSRLRVFKRMDESNRSELQRLSEQLGRWQTSTC